MAKKPQYYKVYPADFRYSPLASLSNEELGFYLRLMNDAFTFGGSIPSDPEDLSRILRTSKRRVKRLLAAVAECFVEMPGDPSRLINQDQWEQMHGPPTNQAGMVRAMRLYRARQQGTHTETEWVSLLKRCQFCCVKCKVPAIVAGITLHKDHIRPLHMGGSDSIHNIQPLCSSCNFSKGSDTTDYRIAFFQQEKTESGSGDYVV